MLMKLRYDILFLKLPRISLFLFLYWDIPQHCKSCIVKKIIGSNGSDRSGNYWLMRDYDLLMQRSTLNTFFTWAVSLKPI